MMEQAQTQAALAFATAEFIESYLYEEDQPLTVCYELHRGLLNKFIEMNRFKPFFNAEQLSRYKADFFNSKVCDSEELRKVQGALSIQAASLFDKANAVFEESENLGVARDLRMFAVSIFVLLMLLDGGSLYEDRK